MALEDRIRQVVVPVVEDLDLELVDLVYGGGRLKITIDHPEGLGTATLTKATRQIGHELDIDDTISSAYTLEVTSPGVERNLRLPAHYTRSIGEMVSLKLKPGEDSLRRVQGELVSVGDNDVTVRPSGDSEDVVVGFDRIAKAKTVFDWGPAPKPGKGPKQPKTKESGAKSAPAKRAAKNAQPSSPDSSAGAGQTAAAGSDHEPVAPRKG